MKKWGLSIAMLAAGTLLGCGPPSYKVRVQSLANSGQCQAAETEVGQNERDPGTRAVILAGIADECYRDSAATIRYLNLAARYGHPVAQEHLAKIGQPIPPADLKGMKTSCIYIGGVLSCSSN